MNFADQKMSFSTKYSFFSCVDAKNGYTSVTEMIFSGKFSQN